MAIKFLTGINSNGAIDASGGITGLDLSNGISGSNFNITGVNEIRINDPGEGIVWTSGSSGNMSLAIKDDSLDNILNLSGTGAQLAVNNAIVATQAWVGSQGYLTSITDHNHDTLYDSLGSAAAVGQQVNERIDTEVFDAINSKQDAGSYLTTTGKAADSNLLDGINSTQFVRSDTNSVTIGRHLDANTTWTNGALTLFLGWYSGKLVIGNNNDGGHDYASALGVNTIPILNKTYFWKTAKFEEDIQTDGKLNVLARTGTWITSNVMADAIGWNVNYGVYIGSNVGGTHYLRGNGTFTTGGSTYNLWHEGNFNPTDKASTESVAAVNARIDEEVFPAINDLGNAIPTNNNQLTNGAGYITSADGGNAATLEGRRANDFLKANDGELSNTDLDTLYDDDSTLYFSNNSYSTNSNIPYNNYFTLLTLRNPYGDNTGDGANSLDRGSQLWFGDTPGRFYVRYFQGTSTGWHPWEQVWTSHSLTSVSQLTNDSLYATESYVNTAVANVIDSAPGTLDTLNELAAALGDDPNFATTVTNSIAGKLSTAGGQISRNGMLDVIPSSYSYVNGSHLELYTTDNFVPAIGFHRGGVSATTLYEEQGELFITKWDGSASGAKIWHSGDFDPGSFLSTTGKAADSNLLDGINSTSFLRSDQNDTMSGALTITNAATGLLVDSAGHASVRLDRGSTSHDANLLFYTAGVLNWRVWMDGDDDYLYIRDEVSGNNMMTFRRNYGATINKNFYVGTDGGGANIIQSAVAGWGDVLKVRRGGLDKWALQDVNGHAQITAKLYTTNDIISQGSSVYATGGTSNGKNIRMYVNDSWAYLTTNVGKYYLNAEVRVDGGKIGSYNEPLELATGGTTRVVVEDSVGHMFPVTDRTQWLGLETNRWQIVFCEILDSAGQHEKNLQNPKGEKSVGEYQTGTVLVWKGGKNIPCTEYADHMRMGIAVEGIDSPLIQGAEPVLVTGPVNEGDYLVTSRKEGHAEAMSPEVMRQQNLFDCVIGKALESGDGESYLIKTWINI